MRIRIRNLTNPPGKIHIGNGGNSCTYKSFTLPPITGVAEYDLDNSFQAMLDTLVMKGLIQINPPENPGKLIADKSVPIPIAKSNKPSRRILFSGEENDG